MNEAVDPLFALLNRDHCTSPFHQQELELTLYVLA